MNSLQLSLVHGHTLTELSDLFNQASTSIEGLRFSGISPGGWSNINLLGETELGKYIVKLPPLIDHYDANPYRYRFGISKDLFKNRICPEPIEIGRLPDREETPFMVSRLVSGTSPSNAGALTESEFKSILNALDKLVETKLTGVRRFSTASEYVQYLSSPISIDFEYGGFVKEIGSEFRKLKDKLLERADSFQWTQTIMHGDLHEPNIIFQNGTVILLDFEACCIGSSVFDIAYLFTQSQNSESSEYPDYILSDSIAKNKLVEMEPLALFSAIAWTLERFANLEKEIIEPNLCSIELKQAYALYLQTKTPLLSMMLK
ncbi:MAG: phosphotransferase [Candidatus Thorarchaeota archaeon]